jgi:hypothetical protein
MESAQFFGTLTLTERIKQENAAPCEPCKKRQIAAYQKKRLAQKTS